MSLIDGRFAAYIAVAALLIIAPGPDMALVTRNALQSGRRAASFTALGVAIGALGWAAASALGIGLLLERSVIAFTAVKLGGAAYLGYLGLRNLFGGRSTPGCPRTSPDAAGAGSPAALHDRRLADRSALGQGLAGNLLNPKAAVIFVSIIPQFIKPGDPEARLALMLLAFEIMLLLWLNIYGYLVSRARRSRAGARVRRVMQRVTGVVLIGLGARLAFERR